MITRVEVISDSEISRYKDVTFIGGQMNAGSIWSPISRMFKEDPEEGRLENRSPGEKWVGKKGSGNRDKERCETHSMRTGLGRKGLGIRGEFL